MKLTRTAQGGTLEDFYARNLDPAYEYYTEEYDVASRLMLALIHYLEAYGIGFDKSVGTRLHHLTFRERTPETIGEVWASAWKDHYTILYWVTERQGPWPGAIAVEGVTTSVKDAAQMIVAAFTRAFHTPDPVAQRRAMREWGMVEHPPEPEPTPAYLRPRAERVILQRIPTQQPETVQAFYEQLRNGGHSRFSREGTGMLAFIDYVETHDIQLPGWVYTQDHDLVFTNVATHQPGVIVQPIFERYCIKYFLLPGDAPWPNAYILGATDTPEDATALLHAGITYLFGSLHRQ